MGVYQGRDIGRKSLEDSDNNQRSDCDYSFMGRRGSDSDEQNCASLFDHFWCGSHMIRNKSLY